MNKVTVIPAIRPIEPLGLKAVEPTKRENVTVFAEDFGAEFEFDTTSGEIHARNKEDQSQVTFVNSSAETFWQMQTLFLDYVEKVAELDDVAADELVATVTSEMKALDSKAFEGSTHWWALVIEQMKSGQI